MTIDLCDPTVAPLNGLRVVLRMCGAQPEELDREGVCWADEQIIEQLEAVKEIHNRMHEMVCRNSQ